MQSSNSSRSSGVLRVTEGTTEWFGSSLQVEDLPPFLPEGLTVHVRKGDVGLEAQGIAGALPLVDGRTLHIIPKVGQVNFFRMLFAAEGALGDLGKLFDAFVELVASDEPNFSGVVARRLFVDLDAILRRGVRRARVRSVATGTFASGRILPVQTFLRTRRHQEDMVAFVRAERTSDTPENRVLTAAARAAWGILETDSRRQCQEIFDAWRRRFGEVDDVARDLALVRRRMAERSLSGPRDYYEEPLMLAEILLGSGGPGMSGGPKIRGDAVLVNTATVFERYVRHVIAKAHLPMGFEVRKGVDSGSQGSLYVDGSVPVDPDVVISKGEVLVVVADAKYKARASADDHYQIGAYLRVLGCGVGALLTAATDEQASVTARRLVTAEGIVVYEIGLPLRDLPATESFLSSVVTLLSAGEPIP